MADKNVAVKNANGTTDNLLSKINTDGSISFYHVEDVAQRSNLLAALAPLSTAALQSTGNASLASIVTGQATGNSSLATIATNTAGLATASAQITGNTALASLVSVIAPAAASASGAITAVGAGNQGAGIVMRGDFNVSFWGTFNGSIRIERTFDGSNWFPLTALGQIVTYTTPATEIFSEPQANVRYRVFVSDLFSGTVNFLISQ